MAAERDDADELEIPSIALPDQVFDVKFHPHNDLVATGLINGQLNLYVLKSRDTFFGVPHRPL